MRNYGVVLFLALAACAAWESKEKQHHARILEPSEAIKTAFARHTRVANTIRPSFLICFLG